MKFMIRDWGPDFRAATSVILTSGGIRTVRCIVRTPAHERDRRTWNQGCRRDAAEEQVDLKSPRIWETNCARCDLSTSKRPVGS